MKRSTTDALREELRAAQANVARLARECAALRERNGTLAVSNVALREQVIEASARTEQVTTAHDEKVDTNEKLYSQYCEACNSRDAARREAADLRTSRDLAEANGAKMLALADGLQADLARWKAAMREGNERIIANAVSYGEIRGTLDVLTRLVLAGDHDAAKAVAQGIAGMVKP